MLGSVQKKCSPNKILQQNICKPSSFHQHSHTTPVVLYPWLTWSLIVYIAIAIYCLVSTRSVYSVLSPFVALVPLTSEWRWSKLYHVIHHVIYCVPVRLPANKLPVLKYRPDPRFFLTVLLCAGVVVAWFLLRHSRSVTLEGWDKVIDFVSSVQVLKCWVSSSKVVLFK